MNSQFADSYIVYGRSIFFRMLLASSLGPKIAKPMADFTGVCLDPRLN